MTNNNIDFHVTKEIFINDIFEKSFHLTKNAIDCSPYTWEQFNADFHGIEPASGNIRVFADGQIHRNQYTFGEQDSFQVLHHFDAKKLEDILMAGATIVINRFDRFSIHAFHLCKQISSFTNHSTVGNAYVTFEGKGTFGKHWDTHCVFAIQMKGRKRWKLYRPTLDLPLKFQSSAGEKSSFNGDRTYANKEFLNELTP